MHCVLDSVYVLAQATITVEALHEGMDFSLALTRAKFEELNHDLFKKTLDVSMPIRNLSAKIASHTRRHL